MRGMKYAFNEAMASLMREWRSAILAVLTIAAGLFVLGFSLVVNTNLQRIVGRWAEAAELSIFLKDDITREQIAAIDDLIAKSGLAGERQFISKQDAIKRFSEDFPDLAPTAQALEQSPFPASFDVKLNQRARDAGAAVDTLATTLGGTSGVADVRYDRRWLSRVNSAVRLVRGVGLLVIMMLAVAAALTVANVVRLAAYARRDEIEIMQLVGAPFAYIRGPFVAEGLLQGGAGALLAMTLLWFVFLAGRARFGQMATEGLGVGTLTFMPVGLWLLILGGGMLLGCIGGLVVARSVR
jgi:cell division transport system permease protein